jgi:hypothetical protein
MHTVIATLLPATSCENHDFAGLCTEECAWLTDAMSGDSYTEPQEYGDYLGGVSSIDWSGCHRGPTMPTECVTYDEVNRAVVLVIEHSSDCQCSDECPAAAA